MTNLPDVQAVVAFALADGMHQSVKSYVDRGRKLKELSQTHLENLYILIVKEWAKNVFDFSLKEGQSDISAEFSLRNSTPPYKRVAVEIDIISKTVAESVKTLSEEKQIEVNDGLINDYLDAQRAKS